MEDNREEVIEQQPVSEQEFKEKIHDVAIANRKKVLDDFEDGVIYLRDYRGVRKFKSVRRAIRRGHVSLFGDVYPDRPFNNRKRNKKGDVTYRKRKIYEQLIRDSKEAHQGGL